MADIVTQYRKVVRGAGYIERSDRGRLRFDGADAIPFLQALVTADLSGLAAGGRRYSTYLTPNGRMLADLAVIHRGDHVLVDVPASRAQALAERFDTLIFTEDVRVQDASSDIAQFSIAGPGARVVAVAARAADGDCWVVDTDDSPLGSVDLFLPVASRDRMAGVMGAAGAVAMTRELAEVIRIDAGRPAFGIDMTEETIPLEAGLLDRAISTSKGCYVGQEIIIRVLHRGGGRVAKRLMKIESEAPVAVAPSAGAAIHAGDQQVGQITSAVLHPESGRAIALGYIARDAAVEGAAVTIAGAPARTVSFAG